MTGKLKISERLVIPRLEEIASILLGFPRGACKWEEVQACARRMLAATERALDEEKHHGGDAAYLSGLMDSALDYKEALRLADDLSMALLSDDPRKENSWHYQYEAELRLKARAYRAKRGLE